MTKKIVSLTNWPVYGLKAGLAAAFSLVLAHAFGCADTVSAAFVAVVCTTPTVLSGIKRGFEQLQASLLGGAMAYACLYLGLPVVAALGVSVGLSVLISGALRMRDAHIVAAFTALFVVLLNPTTPGGTYAERMLAVVLGALAALLVNVALSSIFYKMLFRRRVQLCRLALASALEAQDLAAIDKASTLILELQAELRHAIKRPLILRLIQEADLLNRMAHFAKNALLREEEGSKRALLEVSQVLKGYGAALEGDHAITREGKRWVRLADGLTLP